MYSPLAARASQPLPAAADLCMCLTSQYVHSKTLLYGVYTDRGEHTCVGRPGSQGYEELDAKTYAYEQPCLLARMR